MKSFRQAPGGKRRVTAFLFAGDVFGMTENGRYVNNVQAITKALLFRIPMADLKEAMRSDPHLQFQLLCKVIHELRQGQRHSILLGRRDAPGRLAMFLSMLERNAEDRSRSDWIHLPMSRADVADYLGLSESSVSRAVSALARRGIVSLHGRHAVSIRDRTQFEKLVRSL